VNGNPLMQNNPDYSVRAQICRSAGLTQGTYRINCYSVSQGFLGSGLAVTAAQATTDYQEFITELMPPQTSLPSDLMLQVYADGTPSPNGEFFLVDNIEIFQTNAADNASVVRTSRNSDPESYDGVLGLVEIDVNDGQAIRAAGSWFSLTKLVPWSKPAPWSLLRGHN
jgi:hypothetical protein